jgi:ABC-type glycerol-3-phosphate transport system substrate-binding protein
MRINLGSSLGGAAFEKMCNFFTMYSYPYSYNAANRFRTGEMPIVIGDYTGTYNTLKVFATEIEGAWSFYPLPGEMDENGNINNVSVSAVTASVMVKGCDAEQDQKNAWEFMTWWTSEEAQYRFGTEIESLLGAAARYQTANRQAMSKLPWDKASMVMIQEQWNWAKAIPQVPGGYYTARNIEFAWTEVINNPAAGPNTTFVEYVSKIDREIDRKRETFKDKIAQMTGKAVE